MSSLFASLRTAANSLDVFQQAMGVIQNNVTNSNTPGYAKQTLGIAAMSFQPDFQLWGGVSTTGVESSRDLYAEQAVWSQNQLLGASTQSTSSLNSLQSIFDVSGSAGIPAAMNKLFAAFSAWSTNPTDATSRQQVITAAQGFAQAIGQAYNSVTQLRSQTDGQVNDTVEQINSLADEIASINNQRRTATGEDAGLDAQLYNDLEKLSNLTSITVRQQTDGSMSVLMGGQTPLVLGSSAFQLSVVNNAGGTTEVSVVNDDGQDVTSMVSAGQLAALLEFRNYTIPSVIGSSTETPDQLGKLSPNGSLNQLALSVAARVNSLLTSGWVSVGPPPVKGSPLFYFTPIDKNAATLTYAPDTLAGSLSLDPNATAASLAAIDGTIQHDPTNPSDPTKDTLLITSANGISSQLAGLASAADPKNDTVGSTGMSYTDYYSSIASGIGTLASQATTEQQNQTQSLAQAQNMRSQISGISLNDQAAQLLQFQQAYEASARFISVINSMTQDLMQVLG